MSHTISKDPLIPTSILALHHPELLRRIDLLDPPPAIDVRTDRAGEAFARALLFERWPDLVAEEALDAQRSFYNRYFWFARFAALWQATHGYDAGLEQQTFQILDQAGFDLDWDLIHELDVRAKQDLT